MKKNYILLLVTMLLGLGSFSQLTAPFLEQFNTTSIPTTWNRSQTSGSGWVFSTFAGWDASTIVSRSGTGQYAWIDFSQGDVGAILESDTIDVSALTTPELNFYFNSSLGTYSLNPLNVIYVEAYNGTAWVSVDSIRQDNNRIWTEHFYNMAAYVFGGNKLLVRFRGEEGGSNAGGSGDDYYFDLLLDDIGVFEYSPCRPVTAVNSRNITSSDATIGWTTATGAVTATAWIVEYGPSGFTPGTGTMVQVSVDSADLTGLSAATIYDYYVIALCGTGDTSASVGPNSFITACTGGLAGSYTINPGVATGGTNFNSPGDFFATVLNCGLDAATTVDVVAGTGPYVLNVDIPAIPGASITNTLTMNGNGNVINNGGGGYFIAMNGVKHLTINDFMFVNETPNTQKFGIMMRGGCDSINITNNTINLGTGFTSSISGCIVASNSLTSATTAGFNASNVTIDNNTLIGGYYGIRLNGPTSGTRPVGHKITNNTIEDVYVYSIYNSYTNNFVIKNNDISRPSRTTLSTFYGIYSTRSVNDSILNNKIHDGGNGTYTNYGIYITNSSNSAASHFVIANNAIYNNSTTSTQYPIYLQGTLSYFDVHHNTIIIDAAGGTGTIRGIYVSSTPNNLNLTNNLVSVSGPGTGTKYCYYSNSSTTFTGGNNLFHMAATAGTNNNSYYSGNQATISDWDMATSTAGNSDEDPLFVGGTYFPTAPLADNGGTPLASVPTDIDGATRSTVTPDYGAYEYSPPTCPAPTALAGFNPTGLTHDVTWTAGGTETSWIVEHGPVGFTPGTGTSTLSSNDTATISGLSVTSDYDVYVRGICTPGDTSFYTGPIAIRTVCLTALNGVYTVDPSMPMSATNFVTTDSLFQTLEDCGISGPTTVNFAAGSGPYVFDWDLDGVNGLTGSNTLTLNGNGVTVNRGTGNSYFLALNGIENLTIENFMFINETPNSAMFGIMMRNVCDNITIKNNTINVGIGYTLSGSACVIATNSLTSAFTYADNANNITIDSNTLIGGYYGIRLNGVSQTVPNTGNKITNNTIEDVYYYSIYNIYQDDLLIHNNDISRGNRTTITTFYGVYAQYCTEVVMSNNKIHNTGSNAHTCYPIYLGYSTNTAGAESYIVNNAIYDISKPGFGTFYGIQVYSFNATFASKNINIWHNTISYNTDGTTGTTRGITTNTSSATYFDSLDITNNIVDIYGSGTGTKYAVYTPAIYLTGGNNDIHFSPSAGTNNFAYYGTNQADLTTWETSTGLTGNIENNPIIVAPGYTPYSNLIDNLATPLALVTLDIDGATRSATPDIGAVEFIPLGGDLAILDGGLSRVSDCYGTMDTAWVSIKNLFGSTIDFTTADSLTVYFDVTGPINTSVTTVVNMDSLNVDSTMMVINTGIDMSIPGKYSIKAYINFALNNILAVNDSLISIDEIEVKPMIAITPTYDTLYSYTDSSKLSTQSPFYPGGTFLITEVCHFAGSTVGIPAGGRPSWHTAGDYIEITGVPGSDLAGYTLEQWNNAATTVTSTFTFPSGTVMSPNGTATIAMGEVSGSASSPANFYYDGRGNGTTNYQSGGPAGRILKDPSGNIVDAVGYSGSSSYTFPLASGVTTAEWSGNPPVSNTSWGIRLEGPDLNSATGWVSTKAPSTALQDPNVLNSGVPLPSPSSVTGLTWTDLTTSTVLDTTPEIYVKGFTANGTYPIEASFVTPCGTFMDTAYITVLNQTFDTTIINECDSFALPMSGRKHFATGFDTDTLQSTSAPIYDSVFYVYDINIDTTNETFTLVECDSFVSPNGKTWTTTGTYYDTIMNSLGCDSLMVFNLTVNYISYDTITTTECDTFIAPSGTVFRTTGTHYDTIMNTSGCDSAITIYLTILNSTTSTTTVSVCNSFTSPNGKIWTTTGVYTDTLTNSIGCDSVIVFNLTVNYDVTRTDNITLCPGGSHRVGPNVYTTAGTYTDAFYTNKGCDSIIITNLSYHAPATATMNYNICIGDTAMVLGNPYTTDIVLYDTLFGGSVNGCDVVTTHIVTTRTVSPALDLGSDIVACLDGGITAIASTAYDTYTWTPGGNSSNTYSVTGAVAGSGSYDVILTVTQASTGCTASDTVNVTFQSCVGIEEVNADLNIDLYPNPASNMITIEIFDKYNTGNLKLEILNSIGQVVKSQPIKNINEKLVMDISDYSKGVYLVKISSDKTYITKKLIIQR